MLRREKKLVASPSIPRRPSKPATTTTTSSQSLIMQLPVIVVGRHDFSAYRDSFDRLKDTGD
jgi:hypothetical protein